MTRKTLSEPYATRLAFVGVLALATALGIHASPPPQVSQSVPSTPIRLAEMQHHFSQVMLVHDAVIRGDLPAVKVPAEAVASLAIPSGMPATAAPFVAAIRLAGQRAASARNLTAAASATVAMVAECGNCHRTMGVFPAPAPRVTHDLGGIVGHMQQHQRAADEMLLGLMIPSTSQWREGAERLRVASLRPSDLPPDPKLAQASSAQKADLQVHKIADQAIKAETLNQQAGAYIELLTSCAQCHGLHSKVWGPSRGGLRP